MTEKEFNDWIDTDDGKSAFYGFLYHHYSMGDEACICALDIGDYIESLMEHLEVEIDENQIKLEELEKKRSAFYRLAPIGCLAMMVDMKWHSNCISRQRRINRH